MNESYVCARTKLLDVDVLSKAYGSEKIPPSNDVVILDIKNSAVIIQKPSATKPPYTYVFGFIGAPTTIREAKSALEDKLKIKLTNEVQYI